MSPTLKQIIREAEVGCRVPRGSVLQASRGSPDVVKARRVAMAMYKIAYPRANWSEIGRLFGRDRSSVREGVRIAGLLHWTWTQNFKHRLGI